MERNEPSTWTYFLWWLASADPDVLKNSGPERVRFSIIGVSVLVTWMVATLSCGYFFSVVLKNEAAVGALALCLGLVILFIDRKLIAVRGYVVFRLGLAVIIGLILSQPIAGKLHTKYGLTAPIVTLIQVTPLLIKMKYQYSHD